MLGRSRFRDRFRGSGAGGSDLLTARFAAPPYIKGVNDSAVLIQIRNANVGTAWEVEVTSTGGGTPVTDSGTVTLANFDVTLDLSGLNVGTLNLSYSEDAVVMATDTAPLEASQAGSPIGLLMALTKAA